MTEKLESEQVDFEIVREDWTRYRLEDHTILRVRIVVAKLFRHGTSELGVANFGIGASNLLSIIAPEESLKTQVEEVQGPLTPEQIREGVDLDYELEGAPKWQEYRTSDGWTLFLRPEVGKVVRLKRYVKIVAQELWEPSYWVNVQQVYRVKKTP